MKTKISIKAILVNFVFAMFIGSLFAMPALGVGIFAVGTVGQLLNKAPLYSGLSAMALQTEVWIQDIQETLYYGNEFLYLAQDHSSFVVNKTVHIPQAGAKPAVVKNRTAVNTDPIQRADSELTYDLDNYTTDPILVKNIEDLQVSYAKRQSVLGQHIATLSDTVATETLQKWAVTGSTTHVLRTTGDATGTLPHATATGTRNKLDKKDMARASARMDLDKVPAQERYAVIPACMFYDLFTDSDLVRSRATINEDMLKKGVIAELFGFWIIKRGEVVLYTNASTPVLRASDAVPAVTDCGGAVCFSRFMTSQALGEIMVYINEGDAQKYGDVLSAEVNHGASFLRPNNVGRVSIAQGYIAPV
jgi:hypothetical protein